MNKLGIIRWPLVALVTLTSCVGPARTYAVYEAKAVETAKAVRSAAETARLTAEAAARNNMLATAASVALGETEREATGAQGAFASIQPPDARSDALAAELDQIVARAAGALRDLRIAARRGALDRLAVLAEPLAIASERLEQFIQEHE